MHAFVDPVDGERYVGGYLGLDITQRLFACFDQLDLKAPITLTVEADALNIPEEISVVIEDAAIGTQFLAGDIRFTDIPRLVEAAVDASPDLPCDALQNVWTADAAARKFAQAWKP